MLLEALLSLLASVLVNVSFIFSEGFSQKVSVGVVPKTHTLGVV
jgi:hypothetical protein